MSGEGRNSESKCTLTVAGLFCGIGGIELGLENAGHKSIFLCEIDEPARRVLRERFPDCVLERDVGQLQKLPAVDLVTAGFPCQDLSQAGRAGGIRAQNSRVIEHLFPLLDLPESEPKWLLLENVPFMLQLDRGTAMRYIIEQIERLGFAWAYRIVDARSFGLPQRRRRVILLASRSEDPRKVLLADDIRHPPEFDQSADACGFYWTEGTRGLGWTDDGIPTLKRGSSVGIPCPPAIWFRKEDRIATPDIRDAERLQGFPVNWTSAAAGDRQREGVRWKVIGNSVSVALTRWIGDCLNSPGSYDAISDRKVLRNDRLPNAAWGKSGKMFESTVSEWPVKEPYQSLATFLRYPAAPLSARATRGFLERAIASKLHFTEGFLDAVAGHLAIMYRSQNGSRNSYYSPAKTSAKTKSSNNAMDIVSRKTRQRIMASVRQKDTKPEMIVRKLVHAMGFRYRLHAQDLPGSPDLVFPRLGKILFVHGCFWHRHRCNRATTPSTRQTFWQRKFEENRARDRRNTAKLRRQGWDVMTVWECQTEKPDWLAEKLYAFLSGTVCRRDREQTAN